MDSSLWQKCVAYLENELSPQQFNTWIRPLHAVEEGETLRLLAPNRFVLDWVNERFIGHISEIVTSLRQGAQVVLQVGTAKSPASRPQPEAPTTSGFRRKGDASRSPSNLRPEFTFDSFVEGKSNQLARAASTQVAENPGTAYNPLFIYSGAKRSAESAVAFLQGRGQAGRKAGAV